MAGEYDEKFEQLTRLIQDNAARTDTRFDDLTGRIDSVENFTKKTAGRLDELILDVRDLRKDVGGLRQQLTENGEKLDAFHDEVTTVLIKESKRISALSDRVDVLEGRTH